jgi:hypothetical protein
MPYSMVMAFLGKFSYRAKASSLDLLMEKVLHDQFMKLLNRLLGLACASYYQIGNMYVIGLKLSGKILWIFWL